jgi:hypothetical protein
MRTPAGKECRYFYGDYYRGRSQEECRLLKSASPPLVWSPNLCTDCPIPSIHFANSCQYMVLEASIGRPFPFFKKQVQVKTFCEKSHRAGFDPFIGCGECHPLPPEFLGD